MQANPTWCVLKAIDCKGCKPDRSDHNYVFFQPHLGESATNGRSWHKTLTTGEELDLSLCPAFDAIALSRRKGLVEIESAP